jgi:uncharacterized protein (TIGR00297 family)
VLASGAFFVRLAGALAFNGALAAAAGLTGGATAGGALAGALFGGAILAAGGWPAWLLVAAFYLLGTAATRCGLRRKAAAGLAEARGGRRGAASVFAKLTVPLLAALAASVAPQPEIFLFAFAGALAAATMDTVSSEIGKALGGRTLLVTTLRPVPPGTEGGVSLGGTAAGLAGAAVLAACGIALGLPPGPSGAVLAVLLAAALFATTLESVAGAALERRGLLDGATVNFLASLVGALTAAGLARLV